MAKTAKSPNRSLKNATQCMDAKKPYAEKSKRSDVKQAMKSKNNIIKEKEK